ncbi:hypothetical protein F0562_005686 [Nyssa sinensis]|uniref:Uncharacterized protein n=1 Tax=Nyssa sinensis TaxID=561372 RepID=A0A5J5ANE7_9ASTE|nr:hypothetical protein F0562_005686 [Nyssa sinensis]
MPPHRTQIVDDPISFQTDSSFCDYSITADGVAITDSKEGNVEWSPAGSALAARREKEVAGSGGGKKGKSTPGQKMITFVVEDSDYENRRVEELSTSVASLGCDVNLVSASCFGYSGLQTCG